MNLTIEQVKEDIASGKSTMIFYSSRSAWWTHLESDLIGATKKSTIPCDPSGSPLFQTDDTLGFMKAAESKPEHYGKHKMDAFMKSHHQNCDGHCFMDWSKYNDVLDAESTSPNV